MRSQRSSRPGPPRPEIVSERRAPNQKIAAITAIMPNGLEAAGWSPIQ